MLLMDGYSNMKHSVTYPDVVVPVCVVFPSILSGLADGKRIEAVATLYTN
jgi:hypothetical protein